MGDLSFNISRQEVACKCKCGFDSIDHETLMVVQGACNHFAMILCKRVILAITSGCRCTTHNYNVSGSADSQHLYARAIDHKIREVTVSELVAYYNDRYPGKFGVGEYDNFVHLDTRTHGPARW